MRHVPRSVADIPMRMSAEIIHSDYSDILQLESQQSLPEPRLKLNLKKLTKYVVTAVSILVAGTYLIAILMLSVGPFEKVLDHLEDNTRAKYRRIITIYLSMVHSL